MNEKQLLTFLYQCYSLSSGESITITATDTGFRASMWLDDEHEGTRCFHRGGHSATVAGALESLYTGIESNLATP